MSDEKTEVQSEVKKPRVPRKPRAKRKSSAPVTRGQAVAWGALGLTLGNALTVAVARLLGVH